MTKAEAITELVRIWHSPHLDLSLKAGLAEAIDTLKESNLNDSLVRGEVDACKESESKLDLISRQDAIEAIRKNVSKSETEDSLCFNLGLGVAEKEVESLPSAEPKTGEWIQDDDYICDQCGYHMTVGGGAYNFCPNCGARMTKGGDDE